MPALGAEMEAGTLVEWLKRPGDTVKRGDIIAVVDTEKGAIEVEVFEDGVVDRVVVAPGEKVPVGTVLAHIRGAGEPAAAAAPPPGPAAPRARVSPLARKLAEERHVDLAAVQGSGPQGAITREDVERAAMASTTPAAAAPPHDRVAAMRAAIAAAMARSKREIPHYYLSTDIDLTAALAWLRSENEKRDVTDRLLPAALLIKAVARALGEVPDLNGFWIDGAFHPGAGVHVGFAIALRGGGLVAPALHDAGAKDVGTVMRELKDLTARARSGSLKSSELSDPTITITSLGDRGADAAFGIIYPPQVAIVAFGRIMDRPRAISGRVEARPVVTMTLSADHRASDGHRGGLLLAAIDRLLQTPEAL